MDGGWMTCMRDRVGGMSEDVGALPECQVIHR